MDLPCSTNIRKLLHIAKIMRYATPGFARLATGGDFFSTG